MKINYLTQLILGVLLLFTLALDAQIGPRFPSGSGSSSSNSDDEVKINLNINALGIFDENNNEVKVNVTSTKGKILDTNFEIKDAILKLDIVFDKSSFVTHAGETTILSITVSTKLEAISTSIMYRFPAIQVRQTKDLQIAPNPFLNNIQVQFKVEENTNAIIQLYNSLGQLKAILADGPFEQGNHSIHYNNQNLNSGFYLLRYQDDLGNTNTIRIMKL